jgi:hypothetical protein
MGPQNHGEQSILENVMIVKLVGKLRSFNQPFFAISPYHPCAVSLAVLYPYIFKIYRTLPFGPNIPAGSRLLTNIYPRLNIENYYSLGIWYG